MEPEPKKIVEYVISFKSTGSPFPKGTKLLSLKIKDKTAYVNLNKSFDEVVTSDLMKVANLNTIVATLCLNDILGIDEVQLLIEGEIPVVAPMGKIGILSGEDVKYAIKD